jgi:hypothetical protein
LNYLINNNDISLKFINSNTGEVMGDFKSVKELLVETEHIDTSTIKWEKQRSVSFNINIIDDNLKEVILNPDNFDKTYDMEIIKSVPVQVQAKVHRSKRINKKWLKKYGYKTIYKPSEKSILENVHLKVADN